MDYHSVNGRIVPAEEARIPLGDIGFRRGYAAFDFLRVVDGTPLFLDDHLDRFWTSSALMGLEQPLARAELTLHLRALIARNDLGSGGLQLFLTGGDAADGFTPAEPLLAVYVAPLPRRRPELYTEGASLITHPHRREFHRAKTTNYQMAVLQAPRMRAAGAVDVLYHHDGLALETARSNLFVVADDGTLATPRDGILAGVTRTNLLRALAGHREVVERDVPLEELWSARELFLTSTTKGTMPIVAIDGRSVGGGRPGPVTAEISARFERWVERALAAAREGAPLPG